MNIIDRVKNIIVSPKTEWLVISTERADAKQVAMRYVVPLVLAGAVAAFIGYGFLNGHVAISFALFEAVSAVVLTLIPVFVSAFVVDALAPSFGSEKNFDRSLQLVAYSCTPSMVGALLAIYPPIAILGSLFSFYGIYLWYLGLGPIKHTPEDKKTMYLIVSVIVLIVVWIAVATLLNRMVMPMFGLSQLSRFGGVA